MPRGLDKLTIERLVFIRYMHTLGVEQSHKPYPQSTPAILIWHDSVELFVYLASVQPKSVFTHSSPTFMQYWSMTLARGKLTQNKAMGDLNAIRVRFKHAGTLPTPQEIEDQRAFTTLFFEENTPIAFGLKFESLSLLQLVDIDSVRKHLELAEKLAAKKKYWEAICETAIAYAFFTAERETSRYLGRINPNAGQYFHHFSTNLGWGMRVQSRGPSANSDIGALVSALEREFNEIKRPLKGLQEVVSLLLQNIDHNAYHRFQQIAPSTKPKFVRPESAASDDEGHLEIEIEQLPDNYYHVPPSARTLEDYTFCRDFVIECVLRVPGGGS
jgi:hypothetical protein